MVKTVMEFSKEESVTEQSAPVGMTGTAKVTLFAVPVAVAPPTTRIGTPLSKA
jgi:hypothetical protein